MIIDRLGKELLFFDGAMGTVLHEKGLNISEIPAVLNIENPAAVYQVHRAYLDCDVNMVKTNTFSINDWKLKTSKYTTTQLVTAGVALAQRAVADSGRQALVVLDIGPIGQMLYPTGTLPFETAYELFKTQILAGVKANCDAILIETMADLYEAKAAVLAAKENCDLPIFCTMTFESSGRTFSGTDIETMVTVLEALGVTALGINCSTGPQEMLPLVKQLVEFSSTPILVQPNAGLPQLKNGRTVFDITPQNYTELMGQIVQTGVQMIGGCCGTTPAMIKACHNAFAGYPLTPLAVKNTTAVASYSKTVAFGNQIVLIGERINPTGKKKLKEALRSGDMAYLLSEAVQQYDEGADVLDINLGLPDINEIDWMKRVIPEIQAILDIPLQIDSAKPMVFAEALRIYNGKPLLNSVTGKYSSMHSIFPLVKKYGACVLGLTLDENGIPTTAMERLKIAQRIVETAAEYGIAKKDILIDCLVLTASAQQAEVSETLKAVKLVKEKLGVKTVLGVSNVSYGLPDRSTLNRTFLAMALQAGLDASILNTKDDDMMSTIRAFRVLANLDLQAQDFIDKQSTSTQIRSRGKTSAEELSLSDIISKGLKDKVVAATELALQKRSAMDIIEEILMPVLDEIGLRYERGVIFLPQLIQSAEVAKQAFSILHGALQQQQAPVNRHKIVLATVQGDIHDIGKNIVKIIFENYGFEIIDMGRDVAPTAIVQVVKQHHIKLVGLSALMTTTVESMAQTIKLLKSEAPWCKVLVGGAVLNQQYADLIKADYYARDPREGALIARNLY